VKNHIQNVWSRILLSVISQYIPIMCARREGGKEGRRNRH